MVNRTPKTRRNQGKLTASKRNVHDTRRACAEGKRKRWYAETKANRQQTIAILERISDGFVAFDAQMNYTYVNARGGELLGRKPADLIGKNYWEEYPGSERHALCKCLRARVGNPDSDHIRGLLRAVGSLVRESHLSLQRWAGDFLYGDHRTQTRGERTT